MEQAMQQAAEAQAKFAQAQAVLRGGAPAPVSAEMSQQRAALAQAMVELTQAQQAQETKRPSKVPCKFFSEGRCGKGALCEFSHDPEMYRPKSLEQKRPVSCSFFDQGKCIRGEACPFAHGQEELAVIGQLR